MQSVCGAYALPCDPYYFSGEQNVFYSLFCTSSPVFLRFIVERANAILMICGEYVLARFTRESAVIIPGAKTSTREISIAALDKKIIYVQEVS